MAETELTGKQRHVRSVVLIGGAFVVGQLSVFLVSTLKEMQAKSHSPIGVDMFDFAILLAGMLGSIALSIAAFMSRAYGRYADERDELRRLDTAFLIKEAEAGRLKKAEPGTQPPTPSADPNLR